MTRTATAEVGYPDDIAAMYTHDFADREATLHLNGLGGTLSQGVVTASSYLLGGPLSSLILGNGLSELRGFDSRTSPHFGEPGVLFNMFGEPFGDDPRDNQLIRRGAIFRLI